ncbi:MAG: hypothetical protein WDM80_15700 [Limisphaerales bacterium]
MKKILVIDDDRSFHTARPAMLRRKGHKVCAGADEIDRLMFQTPDYHVVRQLELQNGLKELQQNLPVPKHSTHTD